MAVTSQIKSAASIGEVTVAGWQAAGLLKPSAIKPVITTIEKNLVIRVMGKLQDTDRAMVEKALNVVIG